jgi:hypothetical protein
MAVTHAFLCQVVNGAQNSKEIEKRNDELGVKDRLAEPS